MLGLDFAPTTSAKTDLNQVRVVGGRSRKPSKTLNVPPFIDSSTKTAKPSFGNGRLFFDSRGFKNVLAPRLRSDFSECHCA
jgi:hypothetical protein